MIPEARRKHNSLQALEDLRGYVAEGRVRDKAKAVGKRLHELQTLADADDVHVLGLVRNGERVPGAALDEIIRGNRRTP